MSVGNRFTVATLALALFAVLGWARAQENITFIGSGLDQDSIIAKMTDARTIQFKPIGHTSITFRVRLRPTMKAAYKPKTGLQRHGYQSEIAAYRVARLLGFDNVPPAVFRRVSKREMSQRFHKEHKAKWPKVRRSILWDKDGTAPGAAIYWIPSLRELGLDNNKRWTAWLVQGDPVPEGKEVLARELSNMVLFDFLIANRDRYSGGNLKGAPSGDRVYLRDHDRAFSAPLSPKSYARLKDHLVQAQRFSRSTVERLASVDREGLLRELSRDPSSADEPVLTDLQVADFLERRATALSHIAALVEEFGSDQVLSFE